MINLPNQTPQTQSNTGQPNLVQQIMALTMKNNGQQNSQQQGQSGSVAQQVGQQSGVAIPSGVSSSTNQMQALSQMMGYHPNTMFGYDMSGSGQPTSQQSALQQMGSGTGPTQSQTGQDGPDDSKNPSNFWSNLWSMYFGNSNQNGQNGQQS